MRYDNIWENSDLNKINLNTNYLNNIGDKWQNLITGNKYVVGGIDAGGEAIELIDSESVSTIFDKEIKNPNTSMETYYKGRVGLMYLNEYIYSSTANLWTKAIYEYGTAINFGNNWMDMGYREQTITRDSTQTNRYIGIYQYIESYSRSDSWKSTRPVFYLSSGTEYVSGSGTRTNSYRIR